MDVDLIHAAEIATLKTEVAMLKTQLSSMDGKIDSLLALKNKGAGAFWLASLLFGIGITSLVEYIKGVII